jgi:hypothetical protein
MKLAADNHQGSNGIVINPISFLVMSLNKRGSQIEKKDVEGLFERVSKDGLPKKVSGLTSILSRFDNITMSLGNAQSPHPDTVAYAENFFDEFIKRDIGIKPSLHYRRFSVLFSGDAITDFRDEVLCVGKLRELAKNGAYKDKALTPSCTGRKYSSCSGTDFNIYFQRNEGMRLHYSMCCNVGLSGYVATPSNELTLERMAELDPESIRETMFSERLAMRNTVVYRLLNERKPVRSNPLSSLRATLSEITGYHDNFKHYISAAESLLQERTGKPASVLANALTFKSDGCDSCESCYTAGELLSQAGIAPAEWHEHLEKMMQK